MPKLYIKQLKMLRKIFDVAVERDIQHVFLMGDVYDGPYPATHLIIALRRLLYKYREQLNFHILVGNHDWESAEHHALRLHHDLGTTGLFNFTVYEKPTLTTIDGVRLFVCPHPEIHDVPAKKADWGLGHFGWNNARGENGHRVETGNAPRGRWILGDFHTHQSGDRYVYCGSASQVKWDEKLPKGVILFDSDDWQFLPITPTYKLGTAEIASDVDLAKLDDKTLWSIRTINNYTLPPDYKRQHHNIVHLAPARKRRDLRAAVLLSKEDSVLRNPMALLEDYLTGHKTALTGKEVKFAMKVARKLHARVTA